MKEENKGGGKWDTLTQAKLKNWGINATEVCNIVYVSNTIIILYIMTSIISKKLDGNYSRSN